MALTLITPPASAVVSADRQSPMQNATSAPSLVGTGTPMIRLRHEISRMARTDFTVLVEGESGTQ